MQKIREGTRILHYVTESILVTKVLKAKKKSNTPRENNVQDTSHKKNYTEREKLFDCH